MNNKAYLWLLTLPVGLAPGAEKRGATQCRTLACHLIADAP